VQAVFKHPTNDAFNLRVPNFSIQPGELVAVVGRVGAGKSSLLQAILGNMDLVSLVIRGSVCKLCCRALIFLFNVCLTCGTSRCSSVVFTAPLAYAWCSAVPAWPKNCAGYSFMPPHSGCT
jgi:energy-coupling factor transporter ATP-binding protein EcfA2